MDTKLIETSPEPALCFYERDEPYAVYIMKSGWSKPQLYHVLVEHGDIMQTDHQLLEASQVQEKFGIDVEFAYLNRPIVIRRKQAIDTPNDQEFGKAVRKSLKS
jgi:hypothetical protein